MPDATNPKKRTSNACQRCRGQKIKCSGSEPCNNCVKRRKTCVFDDSASKVLVSKEYLSALHKRASRLQDDPIVDEESLLPIGTEHPHHQPTEHNIGSSVAAESAQRPGLRETPARSSRSDRPEDSRQVSVDALPITNPLSSGPSGSGFISDASLNCPVYLGTSSNWSFSRRVLSAAHHCVYHSPLGPERFMLDGAAYGLGWNGSRSSSGVEKLTIPSLSHARYLISSVQFRIGEVYHLFDESTFMQCLVEFYDNPAAAHNTLWYVQYLLIMAFGKAFVTRTSQDHRIPGAEFFVAAMKLLPDVSQLWTDPFTTAEIYCCAALYLQSADLRYGAYLTIGQGMRTALFQGMHTDLPIDTFGEARVERARRIWWTVYILDRELSSLMGLPIQIADESIDARLPSYESSTQVSATSIHIKLCRTIAQVVRTVYGSDGRLDKRFLTNTKSSLTSMAEIADELNRYFSLPPKDSIEGISRLSATLHLSYHQCVILTTRPLVFSLYKQKLSTRPVPRSYATAVERLHVLLQMCVDSAHQSLSILSDLQNQGLLESLIPFDLESVFCAGVILLMALIVDKDLIGDLPTSLQSTNRILDALIADGNLIAGHRKAEIEQLSSMLDTFQRPPLDHAEHGPSENALQTSQDFPYSATMPPLPQQQQLHDVSLFEDWTWQDSMSSAQLMNVVGTLDPDQFDWLGESFSI